MKLVLGIILISLTVVIGTDHYWRDYNGTVPSDAVVDPDSNLIVARISTVTQCGGLVAAGLDGDHKVATTECNFKKMSITDKNRIQVLCTQNPDRFYWDWVNVHKVETQRNMVLIGYEESYGDQYIGKIFRDGVWNIGKVYVNNKSKECIFFSSITGNKVSATDCLVLKYNYWTDHYWRDYNGTVPSDAVVDPDSNLIVARISTVTKCGGLVAAGLDGDQKVATTECNLKKMSITDKNRIKVLCTQNPDRFYWDWVNVHKVETQRNMVLIGYEESYGDQYIGKIFRDGVWNIGKVYVNNKSKECIFFSSITGNKVSATDCLVLKYNYC